MTIYFKFYLIVVAVLFSSGFSRAQQEIIGLPIQFEQYRQSYSLLNPASICVSSDKEINIGYQGHTNLRSNVKTYYVTAATRFLNTEHKSHVIGLTLFSDKEGDYLGRTRVIVNYGYHTQLSDNLFLSGGVSLGLIDYLVKSSQFSGGGSAIAPDGTVGIWLYNKDFHFGISSNQIFNSRLQPIQEVTLLKRHFNFTLGKRIRTNNEFLAIEPSVLWRYLPGPGGRSDVDISAIAIIQEIFSAGINYRCNKGTTILAGLDKIKIKDDVLKLMLSYNIPYAKYLLTNTNTYEITLRYLLNYDEK